MVGYNRAIVTLRGECSFMDNGFGLLNSRVNLHYKAAPPPRFVVELDPAYRVFFRNLSDLLLFRRAPRVTVTSRPAAFWPDVFVPSRTPWWPFLESILWHVFAAAVVWALAQGWALQSQSLPRTVFNRSDVIYYTPSEYLPPLDTGSSPARVSRKGKPELARQPIISVPPEADNRTQTIITPPNIKLTHDIAVPNIVAWHSANPAVPLSATARSQLPVPTLTTPAIAPPPEVNQIAARRWGADSAPSAVAPPPDIAAATSRRSVATPQAAVIEPPPSVRGSIRRIGDVNIGHSEVVAPAPELPMDEQRALSDLAQTLTKAALGGRANQVVPPPPSIQDGPGVGYRGVSGMAGATTQVVPPPPSLPGAANTSGSGRLIALGIHPAAGPPPMPVVGNRRGEFSATPEGRRGAPGTPDIAADPHGLGHGGRGNGNGGAGSGTNSKLPPGIVVGPGPKNTPTSTVARGPVGSGNDAGSGSGSTNASSTLMADARPIRVTPRRAMTETNAPTEVERQVFGGRRVYSMILNMPNLNSAGGSWIIRFAELRANDAQGDLSAPEAIHKVDPGYPLELMRQNVQGTVTLYAVIRNDGTVGDVRVLNSPDGRLDSYARAALSGWHFRPAMKNGVAIDLEAVVIIPFRAARKF
jgi:TonB family protein